MQEFLDSMNIDSERWHDGVGYAIDAIERMTDEEQQRASAMLAVRDVTWRELEAFAKLDLPECRAAIDRAAEDHVSVELRVRGAMWQAHAGRLQDLAEVLARELKRLSRSADGETILLLLAGEYDSPTVRQALLWASWNRTECAPNCAAQLLYQSGAAADPLALEHREVVLGLRDYPETEFQRTSKPREIETESRSHVGVAARIVILRVGVSRLTSQRLSTTRRDAVVHASHGSRLRLALLPTRKSDVSGQPLSPHENFFTRQAACLRAATAIDRCDTGRLNGMLRRRAK